MRCLGFDGADEKVVHSLARPPVKQLPSPPRRCSPHPLSRLAAFPYPCSQRVAEVTQAVAEVPPAAVLCCGEERRICKPRSEVLRTRGRCCAETPGEATVTMSDQVPGRRPSDGDDWGLLRQVRLPLGWGQGWRRGGGERRMGEGAAGGDSAGERGEWTRAGDGGACRGPPGAVLPLSGLAHHPLPQRLWSRPPPGRPPFRAQLPPPREGGSPGNLSASLPEDWLPKQGPRPQLCNGRESAREASWP